MRAGRDERRFRSRHEVAGPVQSIGGARGGRDRGSLRGRRLALRREPLPGDNLVADAAHFHLPLRNEHAGAGLVDADGEAGAQRTNLPAGRGDDERRVGVLLLASRLARRNVNEYFAGRQAQFSRGFDADGRVLVEVEERPVRQRHPAAFAGLRPNDLPHCRRLNRGGGRLRSRGEPAGDVVRQGQHGDDRRLLRARRAGVRGAVALRQPAGAVELTVDPDQRPLAPDVRAARRGCGAERGVNGHRDQDHRGRRHPPPRRRRPSALGLSGGRFLLRHRHDAPAHPRGKVGVRRLRAVRLLEKPFDVRVAGGGVRVVIGWVGRGGVLHGTGLGRRWICWPGGVLLARSSRLCQALRHGIKNLRNVSIVIPRSESDEGSRDANALPRPEIPRVA